MSKVVKGQRLFNYTLGRVFVVNTFYVLYIYVCVYENVCICITILIYKY